MRVTTLALAGCARSNAAGPAGLDASFADRGDADPSPNPAASCVAPLATGSEGVQPPGRIRFPRSWLRDPRGSSMAPTQRPAGDRMRIRKIVSWTLVGAGLAVLGCVLLSILRSPGVLILTGTLGIWCASVLVMLALAASWPRAPEMRLVITAGALTLAAGYAALTTAAAHHLCAVQRARLDAANACKSDVAIHLLLADDWSATEQMLYRCTERHELEVAVGLGYENVQVWGDGAVDIEPFGSGDRATVHVPASYAVCRW